MSIYPSTSSVFHPRQYEEFDPETSWLPSEEGDEMLIVHLPGFKKEQLRVQLTPTRLLKISGQRLLGGNKRQLFMKEVQLPLGCEAKEITAKFEECVLYVRQPKLITPAEPENKLGQTAEVPKPQSTQTQPMPAPTPTPEDAEEEKAVERSVQPEAVEVPKPQPTQTLHMPALALAPAPAEIEEERRVQPEASTRNKNKEQSRDKVEIEGKPKTQEDVKMLLVIVMVVVAIALAMGTR